MSKAAAYRLALPVGLLFLVLVSTGFALECYHCNWMQGDCKEKQVCEPTEDYCARLTHTTTGDKLFTCKAESKCNFDSLSAEYEVENLKVKCCNTGDLCNKGVGALPATGLILCVAAALLALFS